jgi:hypothetical protein
MSVTEIVTRTTGIRARLQRLLNDKVPFDHYSVGALLDAAWEVGRALEVRNDPNPYELWEGILVAYGERS